MSDIEFSDPPQWTGRGSGAGSKATVVRRLAPLKERPGEWAKVYGPTKNRDQAASWGNALRRGRFSGIEADEFEAVSRFIDGQGWVWARYVGNGGVS